MEAKEEAKPHLCTNSATLLSSNLMPPLPVSFPNSPGSHQNKEKTITKE